MVWVLATLALFLSGCTASSVDVRVKENEDSCEASLVGIDYPNPSPGCLLWKGPKCHVEIGECDEL